MNVPKNIQRQLYSENRNLGSHGGLSTDEGNALRDVFKKDRQQPTDVVDAVCERLERLQGMELMLAGQRRVLRRVLDQLALAHLQGVAYRSKLILIRGYALFLMFSDAFASFATNNTMRPHTEQEIAEEATPSALSEGEDGMA